MTSELEKLAAAVRGKLVGKADASARQYTLRQGEDGKMTCTCGDYKYRQGAVGGECKHIKAHRSGGTPMIRDSVKEGRLAAMEKFAIEFKSPKMQQVLQGAMDRMYALSARPGGADGSAARRFSGTQGLGGKTAPATHRALAEVLRAAGRDGTSVRAARRDAMAKLPFAPSETAPETRKQFFDPNPSSIGRPRENALRAMMSRPLGNPNRTDTGVTRSVTYPRGRGENEALGQTLNAINAARRHPGDGYVSRNVMQDKARRAVLEKYVPDLIPDITKLR